MNAATVAQKLSFIVMIRRWLIFSLLSLAVILFVTTTIKYSWEANAYAKKIRADYIREQRGVIKYEVESIVRIVDYEIKQSLEGAKGMIKSRVHEAYAVAKNLYDQNISKKPVTEIQQLIIDALRAIRYDQEDEYVFISDFNGIAKLLPIDPNLEGSSIKDIQDTRGNYVIRNAIDIAKNKGEGFNSYFWPEKGHRKHEIEKISFIKAFEPFDWYIGTGIFLKSIETRMQDVISNYVENNRFGANGQGYVFIFELLDINGGKNFARVYANPNRNNDTGMFVSDDFRDAKGKKYREELLEGLRENGECYIDYWFPKIGNSEPSPKMSYFKLAGDARFIVAAGVYLDDIEGEIKQVHAGLNDRLHQNIFIIAAIFVSTILVVVLFFNLLSKRLKSDYDLFEEFFQRAVGESKYIDRDKVRFVELDRLAGFANDMLAKKAEIKNALQKEHIRLEKLVDEQKKTQDELRKSEEEYRILVENAQDGICIILDYSIKFCNSAMERLTGYSKAELATINTEELIHPDDLDAVVTIHKNWLLSEQQTYSHYPHRLVNKDGTILWVQSSVVRVSWEDKPAALFFLRDITEQKKLESNLIQSEKLKAIGTLAGGIAHDFNNILSGLMGYAQLALNEVEDMPSTRKKLGQVMKAAERAADLVKQILSFSRSQKIENRPISPQLITKEVLKLIRATIPANIEIKQDLKSEGCVLADATNVHQVVMNLCTNAAHAMKEAGGKLSVTLQNVTLGKEDLSLHAVMAPGNFIKLSIEDTGTGMTKDVQEKAFDPFFTTKDIGEGTGMGLASVHGIVTNLGGFVSIYSEPGQGTSVHVFLPLMKEAAEVNYSPKLEPLKGGTERILFIDDEPTQRGLAEEALSKYGYQVVAFDSSVVALAHFKQNPEMYDLIITDMTMPKMTGDVFTQKIHLKRPDIPVIMCTGYSEVIDKDKAKALDIDAFLYKPVIIADLVKTIREVLDQKQKPGGGGAADT